MKLAIVVTHPIQYYAPVFRLLAERARLQIHVFYTLGGFPQHDKGFGRQVEWDIPLLEGYPYTFVPNRSKTPGSHHFSGIDNPGLAAMIADWKPDALLVYGWAYRSHLQLMRRFAKQLPVWFRGDSTLTDERGGWKTVLRRLALRRVYRHVAGAFYTGRANREYFVRHGVPDERLVFAPHAVDNARFARPHPAVAQLRAELDASETDTVVLFTGKFEEKKNPLGLIEALRSMPYRSCRLLLVGDGIQFGAVTAAAAGDDRIHVRHFVNQSELPAYYQSCDLFCLPSKGPGESWGLAVNEAMAAGKAVLVSRKAGCADDLVHENENGLSFHPFTRGELAEKLDLLLRSPERLRLMGERSRQIVGGYSLEKQVMAIESALIKV